MTIPSRFNHTTKRLCAALLVTGMALAGSGCAKLQNWRDHDKGIKIENLKVPTGYRVALLAEGMPKARHMVAGTDGTLFVGSMAGNVYALTMNGAAVTQQRVLLKGLTNPSGVASRRCVVRS